MPPKTPLASIEVSLTTPTPMANHNLSILNHKRCPCLSAIPSPTYKTSLRLCRMH